MDSVESQRLEQQLAETKEAQLNFVRSEINTGMTLLEVAETDLATGGLEHSRQALKKAETAYGEALKFLAQIRKRHPECVESLQQPMEAFEAKLATVRSRLPQA